MYHRGPVIEKNAPSRPLACALLGKYLQRIVFGLLYHKSVEIIREELLNASTSMNESVCFSDLMVEFIVTHMMKTLPIDLYR